ncbi:hypothetical protein DPMN_170187 [Dreissena polymorpha]|uniref:Uncharacterized protein n=1 Tax=Dreissena polymorpha TaxID=45954 RepID=A0A9D4IBB6_DREPO|nr:hypothetical protein DPMN_170187 [Dreissena polymorpha]
MHVLKEKHMDDFIDVMRTFEIKKRECKPSSSGSVVLRFPATLNDVVQSVTGKTFQEQIERSPHKSHVQLVKDKLRCDANLVTSLFDGPGTCIVDHLSTLLSKYSGKPIDRFVLVGGFFGVAIAAGSGEESFSMKACGHTTGRRTGRHERRGNVWAQ